MKNLTTIKNFIKNNFYAFDIIAILIMVILTELSIADNDKAILVEATYALVARLTILSFAVGYIFARITSKELANKSKNEKGNDKNTSIEPLLSNKEVE